MMKRLLLPVCLLFFICALLTAPANAQDTTKKAEPEKKDAPLMVAPPRTKPIYHRHRLYPAAPPTGTAAATTPSAAARINDSTLKANALKAQQAQVQAQAQQDPAQLNDKSMNGQYQYLLTKTPAFQQPLVSALWKNVTDTLNHERGKVKDLQAKLTAENKVADSLKTEERTNKQTQSESTSKVDTISLFGIVMPKSTYNLVMVGLVVGLAIALTVVILTTSKYKYDAKHHIELHE